MSPIHAASTPIEINASPERVRETLLDFQKMPEWHHGHFVSIEVPSGKKGIDLKSGDTLKVVLASGMRFSPVIQVCKPTQPHKKIIY